jgi:endogenous inhibitor of DNA gyrase (YacG/DUF329 family)
MKTMQMEKALDEISEKLFDRSRSLSMFNLECPTCGQPISKFRDELSEREFRISGMCQECQDEVFSEVPEE